VLDEPWSGVDVEAHVVLGEVVAETKARDASVVCVENEIGDRGAVAAHD
jgi:ABC-type Mn2+/Zn2+ transport system ATPase subunit